MTTPTMSSLQTRGDSVTASKKVTFTLWAKDANGVESTVRSLDDRDTALDALDAFVDNPPPGFTYVAVGITRVTETVEYVALETHTFDNKG